MVVTLTVQTEPPKIEGPKYRDVSVYLGKPISLDCIAAGKPLAQVSWILPDRTIVRESMPLDRPMSVFPNGTLSIHSANFSIKGNYKCIASNAAGADTLTYQLHVAALPPAIKEESFESIHINTGKSIYVHCTAKGEPEPLLKWVLPDGSQLKPTQYIGRRLFVFPNGTLYIKSIIPVDAGRYECLATNMVGFVQRVVKLDIKQESPGPWKGPSQHHSVSALYGSTVFLHCPESADYHRGTVWRLPSRTLLEHHYRYECIVNINKQVNTYARFKITSYCDSTAIRMYDFLHLHFTSHKCSRHSLSGIHSWYEIIKNTSDFYILSNIFIIIVNQTASEKR